MTTPCSVTVNGTASNGTICYAYDAASNLTSYTDSGAAITCNSLTVTICYGYNTLNQLTSLVDPSNRTTTYVYDNNHHRTTTTYPGNTVQTATYDSAQRLTAISAVNGTNTLTNYSYSFTNPTTTKDTLLPYTITQSDSFSHNATTVKSYDVLNHLTEWKVTPGSGSLIQSHDYKYSYDGNGNRTTINISPTNITTLSYNAANEWYQSTNPGFPNPNVISWDAAGNMIGNNGFGGGSQPLTVTYNVREQTATQTDNTQPNNVTWTRTFTGRGQFEQTQETSTLGTHSYTFSRLGLTKITGSTATYAREPDGSLNSQQGVTGGPYYYLSDGAGSVAGLADTSGNQAASYFYCPTGNQADGPWGSAANGNPFQMYGAFLDSGFQSYWMGGLQFDVSSGNAFSINIGSGYQFTWNLDFASALPSPTVGMSFFQQNPGLIFPFSLGNCIAIVLNETCNLQTPPTQVSPVQVTDVGATSFTFTTLAGHFDPVGSTITFSLLNFGGYQYLQQTAQWAPGGNPAEELASAAGAYFVWFNQATNLAYWLEQLVVT